MMRSPGYAEYLATGLRTAVPAILLMRRSRRWSRSCGARVQGWRLWRSAEIYEPRHVQKRMVHPAAGPLRLWCDLLVVPEHDQRAVVFTTTPRTRSARALQALAKHLPAAQRGTRTAA